MSQAIVDGLTQLVEVLIADGYQVIGPTVSGGAIVLAELTGAGQLPAGWGVETGPGYYRLRRRDDDALFAHSAGPQSWKTFLHPPRRKLWSTDTNGPFEPAEPDRPRYALLGVRGCDLAAIGKLRDVLRLDGAFEARHQSLFVVAVNCTEPGGVCFCASMGTGPAAGPGADLTLTELTGHFVVEPGTDAGRALLDRIDHRDAHADEAGNARAAVDAATQRMGRAMPEVDLRALLAGSRESPHWADVAERCLICGNCTMVCPTCFCTTTEDVTDLTGDHAERWQRWSSCFELDFSYLHGGSVRASGESRYRQWITHKLSTWYDQFGGSGCVGCGRCIAWCPVGIDITEEAGRLADA
ncbi:4Fe-4S dicluster domain-containing protein [Kribbella solani]|uniref:Ferredoxin n=1 Tax=Kribbella solani TaxID=236067 RepID=A0A841DNX1_9ACTN|nr:4Fe-4S dicluster domain-containing protein [Kribbella solani]MBB5978466.1 ferredoxin [Kribbella solani]